MTAPTTRDGLIDLMARAAYEDLCGEPVDRWHWPHASETVRQNLRDRAAFTLAAIEAAGLCVVPVVATDAIMVEGRRLLFEELSLEYAWPHMLAASPFRGSR